MRIKDPLIEICLPLDLRPSSLIQGLELLLEMSLNPLPMGILEDQHRAREEDGTVQTEEEEEDRT